MNVKSNSVAVKLLLLVLMCSAGTSLWQVPATSDDSARGGSEQRAALATTAREARARAKLLYETIRGSLAIMHRDFFDEDGAGAIPSASMEDIFHELLATHQVEVKWLVVNTDVVNVDHRPKDAFEASVVKALAGGAEFYEGIEPTLADRPRRFRYAGAIHLRSQCLKCHVKRRTSNETRVAGLVISMPIADKNAVD